MLGWIGIGIGGFGIVIAAGAIFIALKIAGRQQEQLDKLKEIGEEI